MIARSGAGVVLTGGASRRMGADKALLPVDGRPLAVRVADALWEAGCHPVWCQGGDTAALTAMGLTAAADTLPGDGPVAAIRDALHRADGGDVVVAACDLADLGSEAINTFLGTDDPVTRGATVLYASAGERAHLLSWWSAATAAALDELIDDGVRRYAEALERLGAVGVPVPEDALRNVNEPADIERRR